MPYGGKGYGDVEGPFVGAAVQGMTRVSVSETNVSVIWAGLRIGPL